MANRSNPNPRRSSGSGDMDETQVFRPVRGGGQTRGSANDGGYSNNNGYYDGTYDDSYNNGYDGYDDQNGYYGDGYGYDQAQPTLANKLRLLQLNADQRQFVLDNNLTERHARAVLRLPENRRSEALINIAKRRMNARQTDLYIEQLLNTPAKGRHRVSMVKDVRIFVNTIDHAIRLMTDNGVPATAHREEKDGYIEYTVRIPTAAAER